MATERWDLAQLAVVVVAMYPQLAVVVVAMSLQVAVVVVAMSSLEQEERLIWEEHSNEALAAI